LRTTKNYIIDIKTCQGYREAITVRYRAFDVEESRLGRNMDNTTRPPAY